MQQALDYLKRGWSVIPLEPKGKRPLIDWSEYQKRLPTEDEVKGWMTKWPNANTGIVTGAVSGIAIVDIDGPTGETGAEAFSLPNTLTVKSGRGRHLYFRHPGTPVKNCVHIAEKIDIRGDGGYAVAPYSIHQSGHIYAWVGGYAALQQPLAPFPQNVLKLLGEPKQAGQEYQSVNTEPWVSELLKGVGQGEKHQAVIRLAGYFNAKGLPIDVTKTILLEWNQRNTPPAEPKGIIERVEDVYKRYAPSGVRVVDGANHGQRAALPSVTVTTPRAAFAGFKEELSKGASVIPTGFSVLDGHTRGLLRGNLSVIGAWPGVGKTAFTLGLARGIAERGLSVAYFPTEMATNELLRVWVSSGLGIPFKRVMDGDLSAEELAQIESYLGGDLLRRLHIVPSTTPSLADIESAVAEINPDLIVLDYIQHTKGSSGNMRQDIMELVYGLKDVAKKSDAAVVITSQFKRPYRDNSGNPIPPTMFDFAETGQIEREVSMALLMSPTDDRLTDAMEFPVNFNLAKNRFGKVTEFQLNFDQTHVRFSE